MLMRKEKNFVVWAFVSGFFGLGFGTLCSVPYFFVSGVKGALAWIAAGLLLDVVHGVSNFFIALALFAPLKYVFARGYRILYDEPADI